MSEFLGNPVVAATAIAFLCGAFVGAVSAIWRADRRHDIGWAMKQIAADKKVTGGYVSNMEPDIPCPEVVWRTHDGIVSTFYPGRTPDPSPWRVSIMDVHSTSWRLADDEETTP